MKQKLLLKTLLLLCALVAGSSSVWAESETFTFGNGNGKDVKSTTAVTKNGVTVEVTQNGASNAPNFSSDANDVRFQDGNKMSITSTGTITQVVITYTSAAYAAKITQASFNVGTYSYTENATTGTWTGSSNNIEIVNKAGSQTRISQIAVTYTPGSGGNSVATPTFSPGTGTYTTAQNVTLGCTTDGATIHYKMTTDGSTPDDPTESDATYSSAISVTKNGTIIKAKAFKAGSNASSVATATYTIQPTKPTFEVTTVVAGKVNRGTQLTMSAAAGNTIIYTTDGTAPSSSVLNGDIYDTPITINNPMTIKAIAVDGYGNESQQTIATYAIYYAGGVDITPNYSFFGKNAQFSGTTYDEVSGTKEGITVTYSRDKNDNNSNLYASGSAIRFYQKNTLKIDAPSGKTITNVVFTQSNATADDMTSTPSGYNSTTKTWSGNATSVSFTRTGSSYLQFTNIEVVLANKATIAAACTDGKGMYYGTYSSGKAFKVPAELVVSEIKVVDGKLQISDYSTGDVVPANTGVMIASDASGDYTMEIATGGTSLLGAENMLKPSGDAGITAANMNIADTKFYRLTMHGGTQIGFYWGAASGAAFDLAANKAYLAVPAGSPAPEFFGFGGDVTGIDSIENGKLNIENAEVYNLAGQRVANPTKGLYIVNGKKVVIK